MEDADATTVRILDAAFETLSTTGARRTTMNQIADLAGLGVATVYRRFPQKALLIRAVLLREAERLTAVVGAALEGESDVHLQAASGFGAFAQAVSDHPFLVRLLRGDDDDDGQLVASGALSDQLMVLARDYLAGWLRKYQAEGRYCSVDADIVAEIHARLALSLIVSPEGRIPMHDQEAVRAFAEQYLMPILGPE